jgi:hypothetical protein
MPEIVFFRAISSTASSALTSREMVEETLLENQNRAPIKIFRRDDY